MAEKTGIQWVPVPGHSGYRVSSDGRVQSCWKRRGRGRGKPPLLYQSEEWRDMRAGPGKQGYPVVSLGRRKPFKVAVLVLLAFVGPPAPGLACRHLNDVRTDSRLENLAWGTSAQNMEDQRRNGRLVGGERHGMSKLTNEEVETIRTMAGKYTQVFIAARFNVRQGTVSRILGGKSRTLSAHEGRGLHG
jgi:hypothetical protein